MRLIGQPRPGGPTCTAAHSTQDTFSTRELTVNRGNRNPTLANAEKRAQISVLDVIKDNALPIFLMENSFAGVKLKFSHGRHYVPCPNNSSRSSQPPK